jgi:hypothetical protein
VISAKSHLVVIVFERQSSRRQGPLASPEKEGHVQQNNNGAEGAQNEQKLSFAPQPPFQFQHVQGTPQGGEVCFERRSDKLRRVRSEMALA